MKKSMLAVFALSMMLSITASASPATQDNQSAGLLPQKSYERVVKEVRHELVMLPYYGVFDNLSYKVDPDGTVTLFGQVARPRSSPTPKTWSSTLKVSRKSSTTSRSCPPPSTTTTSAAMPTAPSSQLGPEPIPDAAVPPIHIIVNNGHITLEGVVARAMDKQVAGMQANRVPGVFS